MPLCFHLMRSSSSLRWSGTVTWQTKRTSSPWLAMIFFWGLRLIKSSPEEKMRKLCYFTLWYCMLGNFSSFCCRLLQFSKLHFQKNSFRNIIWVSTDSDPDQDWQNVSPDLGPNCLHRLSADNKSCCLPSSFKIEFFFREHYQSQSV